MNQNKRENVISYLFAIRAGMSYLATLYDRSQAALAQMYGDKRAVKKALFTDNLLYGMNKYKVSSHKEEDSRIYLQICEYEDGAVYGDGDPFWFQIYYDINPDTDEGAAREMEAEFAKGSQNCATEEQKKNLFFEIFRKFGYEGRDNIPMLMTGHSYYYGDGFCLGQIEQKSNGERLAKALDVKMWQLKRNGLFGEKQSEMAKQIVKNIEKCKSAIGEMRKKCRDITEKYLRESAAAEQFAKAVHKAVGDELGGLVQTEYWQYSDLMAYFLLTGSADSLRKAIQLTDERVATGALDDMARASAVVADALKKREGEIYPFIDACEQNIVNRLKGAEGRKRGRPLEENALHAALYGKAQISSFALAKTAARYKT